ncbi:MAG: haloacid dehalogenase-like hydrolase [FCB group bacterium]|nr:haloacid dehalogenase-like hydrolase [FCB group bacterium]
MKLRLPDGNIPKIVFLDLDGTLISISSEKTFAECLYRKKIITFRTAVEFLLAYLLHPIRNIRKGKGWNRTYLKGLATELIGAEAKECTKECLLENIRSEIEKPIREVAEQGSKIVLLTAALLDLGEAIAKEMRYDAVIASIPEIEGNILTGEITNKRPWGKPKLDYAREYACEKGISLDECAALGDSWSDRFLLDLCGLPIVVCPARKLQKYAIQKDWQIVAGEHTRWV